MQRVESDIDIASATRLQPITAVAEQLGLGGDDLIHYGTHKAKIKMSAIQRLFSPGTPDGQLILVSAITLARAGEGKR